MARNAPFSIGWKQIQLAASVTNRVLLALATLSLASCDFSGSSVDANYAAGVVLSKENSSIHIENRELVAGSTTKVTVFLRDQDFQPYISPNAQVELKLVTGSDRGQLSTVTNQGDGSYSASFQGLRVGDPISLQASVSDSGMSALVAGQLANAVSGATGWKLTGLDEPINVEPATVRILPAAASLRKSTVTVSADQVISGSSITATFTALDDFGNRLPKGGLAVSFSNSGGQSTGVWGPTTDVGDGTYTAAFTGSLGGTPTTMSASMGGSALTRESSDPSLPTVTVSGGQPFSIAVVNGSTQTGVVGTTLAPWTAVVKDSNNNPLPNITVNWAFTSGGGSLSAATSVTNALGQASSTFTLGTLVGVSTVTASVDGRPDLNAIFSATGVAGAVQSIAFSTLASGAGIAGTALTTQPVVTAKDANGNVVPSYTSSITFTGYSDAGCNTSVSSSLSGNVNTASSGAATFTALTVLKTSIASLKASDGTRFTSCATIAMSPGAATQLVFSQQPGAANAFSNFSPQPIIQIQDANGNVVTSGVDSTATISMTLNSGDPTLSGTLSRSAVSGVATFTNLSVDSPGAKTLLATKSSTVSSGGTPSLTRISNSFTIGLNAPSAPTGLVATGGTSSVALTWAAATGSGTISYNVLRSTTSGSGYTVSAS